MERGSCCLGLPPCSSTQNMALCSAHESLWHCELSWRWGWGFSWATEGCWEGRSWLPECSLLSSTEAWTWTHTRADMQTRLFKSFWRVNSNLWRGPRRFRELTTLVAVEGWCVGLLQWSMDVNRHLWERKPTLPQHCSDDCPSHQPAQAQVQSEEASSHSCSHTHTRVLSSSLITQCAGICWSYPSLG